MTFVKRLALAVLLLALPCHVLAQVPGVQLYTNGRPASPTNPIPTSGSGGGGDATAANQALQLTQETTTATGVGTPADSAWASGSGSIIAILKAIAARGQAVMASSLPVTIASNQTAVLVSPTPTAGQGCTPYHLANGTAATTNSTSIKGSAGTLCHLAPINTTAALAFLKIYDSASAPTCSSATGLKHVYPIPASTTGAGVALPLPMGEAYASGIGFCVTAGQADTDNTATTTGIAIEASYK